MTHPMVFCEMCNIGVSSEVTMRDHVKGRRHQQALGALERRKALARNSLYCHGFHPSTPSEVLRSYFQQFGAVTRIMLETHRGCYCIVQYDGERPVQMALAHRNHQLHDHPLTVRPRKPISTYRRPSDSDRSVRKAKTAREEEDQAEASHEQLMSCLLQADSVLSQMELLYETMRLTEDDLEKRAGVCDYLQSVLYPFLPTCSIHQFGSSVNGFGMRGCDMDIFLDLHDTEISLQREDVLRQKLKPINLPYIREMQMLKTTEGPLLPSQLRQLSLVHRVKLVSRILLMHGQQCGDVLFVPSLRCPIVRFVHTPTGIKCDLSINNRLALRNTQLLAMCAEDRRVRLMVFAVRYWGKWKQVAGNQNCGPRLSNYCLSLLVLFYLANTSPPLLPSVQALADMAGPEEKCVIDDWDCSLPAAVPSSLNTQPADKLLHGFFQLYHQVSLSSSVILTRPGKVMPLNDFLVEKMNTPQLVDFKVRALAVQDPFVLQHNIAQNLNNPLRDLLIQEMDNAYVKTITWSPARPATEPQPSQDPASSQPSQSLADQQPFDGPMSQHPSEGPTTAQPTESFSGVKVPLCLWGLPYLFSAQDCKPVSQGSTCPPSSSSSSSAPAFSASDWCEVSVGQSVSWPQYTCPLALNLSLLSQDVLTALRAKGDYRAVWFCRVRTLFLWALRDVFLFTVRVEEEEDSPVDEDDGEEDVVMREDEGGGGELGVGHRRANEDEKAGLAHREGGGMGSVSEDRAMPSPLSELSSSTVSPGAASSDSMPLSPVEKSARRSHSVTAGGRLPERESTSTPGSALSGSLDTPGGEQTDANSHHPHCDTDMALDAAYNTLPGQGDSSGTGQGGVKSSQSSVVPLRVEFSPVGDGKVYVGASDATSCHASRASTSAEGERDTTRCEQSSSQQAAPPTTPVTAQHRKTGKKCRPFRVHCEGRCKTWYGRKVARAVLLAEGRPDNLELEKLISAKLAERDAGSDLPVLGFRCLLVPVAKSDQAAAEVWFEPVQPTPKEFSVFTTFFKSFFTKLVAKNLLESPTV